ncbi:MAG: nucleotidyltransferase domain-containing protein [Thermoleophilaceae bacterium]
MTSPLEQRHAERERLVELARDHARRLARRLPLCQAAVVGSVARGDFNVWSDVDVVVVADELPERALDRLELLMEGRPPRVEVIGFTPAELRDARRRRNPLAIELDSIGIPLL